MNLERIDAAINVMRRAQNLSMTEWQACEGGEPGENLATNIGELHACGNTACFAGYLALSPEFQAVGGVVGEDGAPMLFIDNRYKGTGSRAVANFLEVSVDLASRLVYGGDHGCPVYSEFYGKPFAEVTPKDVIAKLELIKTGELT